MPSLLSGFSVILESQLSLRLREMTWLWGAEQRHRLSHQLDPTRTGSRSRAVTQPTRDLASCQRRDQQHRPSNKYPVSKRTHWRSLSSVRDSSCWDVQLQVDVSRRQWSSLLPVHYHSGSQIQRQQKRWESTEDGSPSVWVTWIFHSSKDMMSSWWWIRWPCPHWTEHFHV